jgi:1-acyl-sn-glycerol-3-phosphate acyltransferase
MNPWVLLMVTACLLLLPAIVHLAATWRHRAGLRPEIHGFQRVLWVINASYCVFWHQLHKYGRAPLPEHGPAILIANHTSGIDHMLLQAACYRVLGFMIAREYYEWAWIKPFCRYVQCIPVNRDGRDIGATRAAFKALKEGRVLPIFPEGHIVPASGKRLGEIKPGTAFLAVRARVPVVPAYIWGTPETDQIIEALMTPSRARVIFGDPIDLSDIDSGQASDRTIQAEVSERFKKALVALQARAFSVEE